MWWWWFGWGYVFAIFAGITAQAAPYGAAVYYGLTAVGCFLYGAADKIVSALEGDGEEDDTEEEEIKEVDGPQ